MSIVKTYDVFCDGADVDGERCLQWTDGVTGHATARNARRIARGRGWIAVRGAGGTLIDFCPEHRTEYLVGMEGAN